MTPESLGKPPPVGVVSHASSVLENNRVDRIDDLRLGGKIVQIGHDGLLAGMGDIQSSKSLRLGVGKQDGKRCHVDAKRVQIEQLVNARNAVLGGFAHMQRGGG